MKKKRKKEGNINVQTHQARIIRGVFIFFNHICLLSSYERNQRKFSISQNSIASFNYHWFAEKKKKQKKNFTTISALVLMD